LTTENYVHIINNPTVSENRPSLIHASLEIPNTIPSTESIYRFQHRKEVLEIFSNLPNKLENNYSSNAKQLNSTSYFTKANCYVFFPLAITLT
jgi:hypothetical protein